MDYPPEPPETSPHTTRLLADLVAERYDQTWWPTRDPLFDDSPENTARRRAALLDDLTPPDQQPGLGDGAWVRRGLTEVWVTNDGEAG